MVLILITHIQKCSVQFLRILYLIGSQLPREFPSRSSFQLRSTLCPVEVRLFALGWLSTRGNRKLCHVLSVCDVTQMPPLRIQHNESLHLLKLPTVWRFSDMLCWAQVNFALGAELKSCHWTDVEWVGVKLNQWTMQL